MKTLITLLLFVCGFSAFAQMDSLAYINWISKTNPAEVTQLLSESTEEFALRQYRYMSGWEQSLRQDYLDAKESLRTEEVRSDAQLRTKTKMKVETLREKWTPASELLSSTREVYLSREGATLPVATSMPKTDMADTTPRSSGSDRPSTTSPSSSATPTATTPTATTPNTAPSRDGMSTSSSTRGKSAAQRSREMEAQKLREKEMLAQEQAREKMVRQEQAMRTQKETEKTADEAKMAEMERERAAMNSSELDDRDKTEQSPRDNRTAPARPSRTVKKRKSNKKRSTNRPSTTRPSKTRASKTRASTSPRASDKAVSNRQPALSSSRPAGIGSVCDWADASQCTTSEEVILLYDPSGTGDLYSQYYVQIGSQLKLVNDQVILSYTIMLEDVPMAGAYSALPAGSIVNLRLLGAEMLQVSTRATSNPSSTSDGKVEYSFQCFLSESEAAILRDRMLDGLEVNWPKGPQIFPIQNSDIYKRQLECQMKCKG